MAWIRVRGMRQLQLCLSGKAAAGTVSEDHEKTGISGKEKEIGEKEVDFRE